MDDHDEVLTKDDIDRLLRQDADRVERAQRDLSTARSTFQRLTTGGSAEMEAAAIAEYEPALRARERDVIATVDSVERNTRQAISALDAGRQPVLSAEELSAASAAREFVKEDCATLPPAQLRDRMRAAVLAGDRSAMYLWQRYGGLRELTATGAPGEEAAIREIRTLLAAMRQQLQDTRFDGPLGDARELLGRAVDLRTNAGRRQSQAEAEAAVTRILGGPGVPIPGAAA